MAQSVGSYTNPLKKFKLVFLGEQSGTPYRRLSPYKSNMPPTKENH